MKRHDASAPCFSYIIFQGEGMQISLNDIVKVKLTPKGAKIYYHWYNHMPRIDEDGFTSFMLWQFIHIYGNHIELAKENVIEDILLYF